MSDHTHPYRLLLVEDNPADMRLLLEGVRHAGLDSIASLIQCYSSEECLRQLERSCTERQPYHLALMDLNMPRTSGKELLRTIRADRRYRSLPICIYTNSDSPRDMEDCLLLGADLYLQKPSDFSHQIQLFEAIRQSLLTYHRVDVPSIREVIPDGLGRRAGR